APNGEPAPQAQVWFQSFGEDADGKYLALPLNAAGEFQVEATAASFSSDFFGRILVYHSGFAPAGGNLNRLASKNIYQLQPPLPLSGRVLDEKNQPVAGARVSLSHIMLDNDP